MFGRSTDFIARLNAKLDAASASDNTSHTDELCALASSFRIASRRCSRSCRQNWCSWCIGIQIQGKIRCRHTCTGWHSSELGQGSSKHWDQGSIQLRWGSRNTSRSNRMGCCRKHPGGPFCCWQPVSRATDWQNILPPKRGHRK